MSVVIQHSNELLAEKAFGRQAAIFDTIYSDNTIVNYKRQRVRNHVLHFLKPGSNILELNSGTGEDALFFARHGHRIHATDISIEMQNQLKNKVQAAGLENMVSNELCSYAQLNQLKDKGPYDLIFSNFAGLNCTGELDKVLLSLSSLLKSDGMITMSILPKFCLWETLLLFKGKFKTAFRRFFSKNGRKAHLEGVYFDCYYYNPSYVIKALKNDFNVVSIEGLCTIVPPSYIEHFAEKYPSTYRKLRQLEDRLKASWPWRNIGDYYIISLRKKI